MTPPAPPAPPLVADWLLSSLSRRLYLAAEVGVLASLEYPPGPCARFVADHFTRPMAALAEVLRLVAAESEHAEASRGPLEGVVMWSEQLTLAMRTLGQFRSLSREACDDAAARFTDAWTTLRRCIVELAAALAVEVSFLRDVPPERERAVRSILDGLCAELLAEHWRRSGRE